MSNENTQPAAPAIPDHKIEKGDVVHGLVCGRFVVVELLEKTTTRPWSAAMVREKGPGHDLGHAFCMPLNCFKEFQDR